MIKLDVIASNNFIHTWTRSVNKTVGNFHAIAEMSYKSPFEISNVFLKNNSHNVTLSLTTCSFFSAFQKKIYFWTLFNFPLYFDKAFFVTIALFQWNFLLTVNGHKQRPEVFYKKAVLKSFAIFTGKLLCWSPF